MATVHPAADNTAATIDDADVDGVDDGVQNSKDDAISPREFELLVEGTYTEMEEYYGLQSRFVLFLAGRLGLRAGEIAHMQESWVDWDREVIVIPAHEPCRKGRDGGICGLCRQHGRQKAETRTENAYEDVHDELGIKDELEPGGGEAVDAIVDGASLAENYWMPKTDAAAREVPFGALTRAGIVVERFFANYDAWPLSQVIVNRRVKRVMNATHRSDVETLYPHALRASAANYWVSRGLDERPLKYLFGWEKIATSAVYIQRHAGRAHQAISEVAP